MVRITRAESFVHRVPITVPVVNALGAMTERVAVFVRLEDAEGAFGWGGIWANCEGMPIRIRSDRIC